MSFLDHQARKIPAIIDAMERGEPVSLPHAKALIRHHKSQLQGSKAFLSDMKDLESGLADYVAMLKDADRLHGQAMNLISGKKRSGGKIERRAESAYEKALERLSELVAYDPSLWAYLDRGPFAFDNPLEAPSPNPESVPRLRSSRSSNNRNPWDKPRDTVLNLLRLELEYVTEQLSGAEPVAQVASGLTPAERMAKLGL